MTQEITINIPQSWADITLKKYLGLLKELKNYEGEEEAQNAIIMHTLCNIEPAVLHSMAVEDYRMLQSELQWFTTIDNLPLQRLIEVNGIQYGFEPNLSKMAYGAYVDITAFNDIQIDENWAQIMSILYRPVDKVSGEFYSIQPYKGKENAEQWLDVPMHIHFGCLFFFINLSRDLLKSIQNYMMEKDIPQNIKQILEKSGEVMQQFTN
jgi:hypothetical protein